jgi:hypothetical protein
MIALTILLVCVVILLFGIAGRSYSVQGNPKERPIQIAVSVIIVGVSLFIFIRHWCYPQDMNWAFGAVGTTLGFWISRNSK